MNVRFPEYPVAMTGLPNDIASAIVSPSPALLRRDVAVDNSNLFPTGRCPFERLSRGRVPVSVDTPDKQRRSLPRSECTLERLDEADRVLPFEDAEIVEAEEVEKPFGEIELRPAQRRRRGCLERDRHDEDRLRG